MNTLNLEKPVAKVPQRPLSDLLTDLRQAGVQVWLDGDRLRYKAPKGALTPALMGELRDRKADIVAYYGEGTRARLRSIRHNRDETQMRLVVRGPQSGSDVVICAIGAEGASRLHNLDGVALVAADSEQKVSLVR